MQVQILQGTRGGKNINNVLILRNKVFFPVISDFSLQYSEKGVNLKTKAGEKSPLVFHQQVAHVHLGSILSGLQGLVEHVPCEQSE